MNTVFHGISSISILKAKIWNLVRRSIKNIEKINQLRKASGKDKYGHNQLRKAFR